MDADFCTPFFTQVIISPVERAKITPAGLHIPDTAAEDDLQFGRIVAHGDECRYVKEDEIVLFNTRAGYRKEIDGSPYYFVHENTIFGSVPGRYDPSYVVEEEETATLP